jgi:hypothetical protein
LKLTYDEPLSNLAFNFNLRRYMAEEEPPPQVGRCRSKRDETSIESAWFQRLKLMYDELLSSVAMNINLSRYTWVDEADAEGPGFDEAGRCRLTLSNPSLNRLELSA